MKYLIDGATGSAYGIVKGELVQYPLSTDNTFDTKDNAVVDWDFIATELPLMVEGFEIELYKHMKGIETALSIKF